MVQLFTVGGAGAHLRRQARWLAPTECQQRAGIASLCSGEVAKWVNMEGVKILPYNLLGGYGLPKTIEEAARITGWLKAARECSWLWPARELMKTLFSGGNRGTGSPTHAGNRDTPYWVWSLWSSPELVTETEVKGVKWLTKRRPDIGASVANRKFFDRIGRLSPHLRWAAVSSIPEMLHDNRTVITHRDIDWVAVSKAQRGPRTAAKYATDHAQQGIVWGTLLGIKPLESMKGIDPHTIKKDTFRILMDRTDSKKPEMVDAVVRLTLMFRDLPMVERWVSKTTNEFEPTTLYCMSYLTDLQKKHYLLYEEKEAADRRIHDAAQMLPMVALKKGWGSLLLRAPAQMLPVLRVIVELDKLVETVPATPQAALAAVEEHGLSLSAADLTSYERGWLESRAPKNFEGCPAVSVTDKLYQLVKLNHNDPNQVTAGRLTNCCQHLEGVASSCAKAAWQQGDAAIYALYKGDKMVAQTFAWRSSKGSDLVFDSVEGFAPSEVINKLFSAAAEKIIGRLGITRVLVGGTSYGVSRSLAPNGKVVKTPKPSFDLSYSDARGNCRVVAGVKPLKVKTPAIAIEGCIEAVVADEPQNVLMEGSDVFCEHCGAEVHPEAAICPMCGQDISEWVD